MPRHTGLGIFPMQRYSAACRLLLQDHLAADCISGIDGEAFHLAAIVNDHVLKVRVRGRLPADRYLIRHRTRTIWFDGARGAQSGVMGPRNQVPVEADFPVAIPLAGPITENKAVGGERFYREII